MFRYKLGWPGWMAVSIEGLSVKRLYRLQYRQKVQVQAKTPFQDELIASIKDIIFVITV